MKTQTHLPESVDSVCMAYGHEVKELLSMCSAETWIEDLWAIFTGYMLAQGEMGFNPRLADIFTSFRDLVMFFEKVKAMRAAA
ncbi:MAG: hypothetical protein ABIN80_16585 [Dyadobacter sp.]|uniref:hypothetical protein n=1 Tax=Dyadobacter sp. TaxID=1914288 RepID=UPI003267217C